MILGQTMPWMYLVTFALLTKHLSHSVTVAGMSVDPPENIKIIDPGHLGYLNIEWSQPSSLHNLSNCDIRYQLRFYDTYTERWKGVQTSKLFYAAQFNLEKPIRVRMLTLLKGLCTNGTSILGKEVEHVYTFQHKEFNICVNGSSEVADLQPAFFSLSIQNHVKPGAVSKLHMTHNGTLAHVKWDPPSGPIPEQCLEYELEITTVNHNGSEQQIVAIEETAFMFHQGRETKRTCFRVRSKVNIYCADDGFWSDWSQPRCIPETELKIIRSTTSWSPFLLIAIIASVTVLVGTICFILWVLRKMWNNRSEQKHIFRALFQEKVQKVIPPIFSPMI